MIAAALLLGWTLPARAADPASADPLATLDHLDDTPRVPTVARPDKERKDAGKVDLNAVTAEHSRAAAELHLPRDGVVADGLGLTPTILSGGNAPAPSPPPLAAAPPPPPPFITTPPTPPTPPSLP